MTIECRDCPGSGHVGAGVSKVCLPWTAGGCMRLACHDHPTKVFGRNNTTRRTTTPDHRFSGFLSSSNIARENDPVEGGNTQPAGCPVGHPRIPSHKGRLAIFFYFSFRSFSFRPLPFRTIAHTLVRTVSPALCRFARSDTPWPQGSRTYSAQKMCTCPGHTDRPILVHIPLISLRDSRQEHS